MNDTQPKRLSHRYVLAIVTTLVAWCLLLGYWIALAISTHLPPKTVVMVAPDWSDKSLHIMAYAGLAVLAGFAWRVTTGSLHLPAGVALMTVLTTFATLDELTQPFFQRHCDLNDWLADLVGTAIGLVLFRIVLAVYDAHRERLRRRTSAATQQV